MKSITRVRIFAETKTGGETARVERGMSEEEAIIEEEVTPVAAEEGDETEEVIDLNAALLEAMVKRTEILERFAKGEVNEVEAGNLLEAVKVPSLERRRRRKR